MAAFLLDTNVILRFVKPDDRDHALVQSAVARLWAASENLCYTSQNLGEFWNTCTRPVEKNGFGLSIDLADQRARMIEAQFTLLLDSVLVHRRWRELIVSHRVSGVQVHDARIAAAMMVHGVKNILTFNVRDFARFEGLRAVHPREIDSTAF